LIQTNILEREITQYTNKYHSPLGGITMASNGEALTGLWFDHQKYFGDTLSAENEERDLPIFEQARRWLNLYFCGENPDFTPPLSLYATPFRLAVWEILKSIPYGQVMTYGDIASVIAKQMGLKSMSAQAVGGAVGHNPLSIIIPCHRVVGSNGSLTGYAGGIDKKVKLLALEKTDGRRLFVPKNGTAL
jgi:methylated-DNA-[protein]-cysteine S-methyltransferase